MIIKRIADVASIKSALKVEYNVIDFYRFDNFSPHYFFILGNKYKIKIKLDESYHWAPLALLKVLLNEEGKNNLLNFLHKTSRHFIEFQKVKGIDRYNTSYPLLREYLKLELNSELKDIIKKTEISNYQIENLKLIFRRVLYRLKPEWSDVYPFSLDAAWMRELKDLEKRDDREIENIKYFLELHKQINTLINNGLDLKFYF